ncbi:MAG: response regulator [Magnetococcus sp. DMHC-8]
MTGPDPTVDTLAPDETAIRILLIDDQPLTGYMIRQMLAADDASAWRLDYLQNPLLAEATVHACDYDVILLDLVMPGLDGLELLQRLRELPRTRQLPIVMLTSTDDAAQKAMAFFLGANDYLIKLPDEVEMVARLRHYGQVHRAHLRQKALEQDLLDREAHLQAVLDNALLAIITIDRTGRVIDVNPAATQLLGYARPAMLGEPMARFVLSEPFWEAYARAVQDCHQLGDLACQFNKNWLVDGLRENGKQVDLEMAIVATTRAGEICFTAFLHDVTDHKQLLKSLEETLAAAETASRIKSDFLATMSHEIRTPMNAVIGLTDLALQSELTPKTRDYLSKIRDASRALLHIINDILDFSKMDAGRMKLEAVPFQLADLFDHLAKLFRKQAEDKGLALLLEVDPDCRGSWLADVFRVEQILINLISNAIKFTEKGRVACRVRRVAAPVALLSRPVANPSGTRSCCWFEFAVRDTGIGLTVDQQDHLFNPFMQADSSTTRRHGGTGLGLSICKRIVEAMGGQIRVESRAGEGSLFYFTVALTRTKAAAEQRFESSGDGREPEPVSVDLARLDQYVAGNYHLQENAVDYDALRERLGGAHLLLVEDLPINQQVARELLEKVGIRVDLAQDGAIAVQMATAQRYDAILMDIQMPGMDGYEATRRIRAGADGTGGPWTAQPIIAMTAHALFDDRAHCLAAGMNDYVSKPVDQARLYEVLMRWVTPGEEGPRAGVQPAQGESDMMDPGEAGLLPARLPGIDVADGLHRTGGNHRLYRALLQEFAREFAQTPAQVQLLLAGRRQDDLLTAGRAVHAIRGMAGNLAARELFEIAHGLEQAIREERRADWSGLLDRFGGAMDQVVTVIQGLPADEEGDAEPDDGVAVVAPDRAIITPLLSQLARFVADGNVEALSQVKELVPHLRGTGVGSAMKVLDDCLEQLDFDGAQVPLAAIAQALGVPLELEG